MTAVSLEGVTKTFRQFVAVDDLSLQVPRGSIYGFIGPNGSGKTTTLRMIMRILYPDRGILRVLDEAPDYSDCGLRIADCEFPRQSAIRNPQSAIGAIRNREVLDRVGYLPEERGLYKQMKVRDVLRFYAELKGFRKSVSAIDAWLERLDLAAWSNKKVEALSKGMAQKVQFIATVIARPELILLDEPFSGLDPVNTEIFRKEILDLRRDGATIIFSTHDMSVAEKLCDFIFMIHKGRKVLDGTLESIQDAYGSDTLRVHLEGPARLDDLPGVVKVIDLGRWQELRLEPKADPQAILAGLMQRGRVLHFERTRPTLHDIFVRIAQPNSEAAAGEDKDHA